MSCVPVLILSSRNKRTICCVPYCCRIVAFRVQLESNELKHIHVHKKIIFLNRLQGLHQGVNFLARQKDFQEKIYVNHCCHDKFKTMCSNTLITIVYLNSSFPFTDSLSFWPSNSRSTNPILPTNHRQLSPCNFERANLGCEGFSCPYFHRFQKYPLNWVNLVCLRRPEHWPLSSCRLPTLSLILGVPIQCDHDRCCPQCK